MYTVIITGKRFTMKGCDFMNDTLKISSLIKRYIRMRGKTLKQVANDLGYKYTTLSGILCRDTVSAELLFELANLLDMDIQWMAQLFDHHRTISSLDPLQIPRMQEDFRAHELPDVLRRLDSHIRENPESLADIRRAMLQEYGQLYYLLDVLLPEDYAIKITVERGKETCYCYPSGTSSFDGPRRGRNLLNYCEGNEMLSRLIAQRREFLK